jgi:DNA-binding GntR family transcriptional regulator
MEFKLKARVSRSDSRTIRQALGQLAARGAVKREGEDFIVEGKAEGASSRELNRALLSALRKVEKKATLRAEWTSSDGTTEKFFDYVLKKTIGIRSC